jgi:hypothetical protein
MEKPGDGGEIDLNQVFSDDGRDLNVLFPDLPMRRFLKEIEQQRKEVRTFLSALEIEDEERG